MARSIQRVGSELKTRQSFCRLHLARHSRLVRDPGHHTFFWRLNEKSPVETINRRNEKKKNLPFFGSLTSDVLNDTLDSFTFNTLLILVVFEDHFRTNH